MVTLAKRPKMTKVDRAELRRDQAAILKKAAGKNVIVVRGRTEDEEKYIVDKRYFEDLLQQLRSTTETLAITADVRLFGNLLKAAETIEGDLRHGKPHSLSTPLTHAGAVYVVKFTDNGLQDLRALPKSVETSMKKELRARLSKNPLTNSFPLNPPLGKFRSCHAGEYRALFHIAEDVHTLAIAGIGKHSADPETDASKKLEKLAQQDALAERLLGVLLGF